MIARCGGEGSPEGEDEWDGGDSGRPQSTGSVRESPSGGTTLGLHNAVGYFRKAVEGGKEIVTQGGSAGGEERGESAESSPGGRSWTRSTARKFRGGDLVQGE